MPLTNRLEYYKTLAASEAKELQQELKEKISLQGLVTAPQFVAGADISFDRGSELMHAAIVVLQLPALSPVARSLVTDETTFPYIPGLLAFREIPVLIKAWGQLQQKPDVLILDGHGTAHPRRMGIATHFGIEVDWPTIGCAKNILTGSHDKLGLEKGEYVDLKEGEERIGMVLRSRTNVNPIYISPGHKVSFDDTYDTVMKSLNKYKLPETTRQAHRWANKLRKGEAEPGYVEY
ncbi:deoxyribonuclease V [Fodinibius halophilus]|uniref:Endonuclease V n=1 Tax=Fodinibius halophilus TaxID=1736908 RepID=A0A6M1TAS6_9BACT|nr:deoxyribonuclease V [Fodinibius halophilus]NGP88064.1 deoxyribonuclease V [Fodinibius halophilus]